MGDATLSPDRATEAESETRGNSFPANIPIRERLERLISQHPVLGKWNLKFICSHWASSSDVLEYRRGDDPEARPLMIKHRNRRLQGKDSRQEIEGEFRVLEGIWDRANDSFRKTIPRPISLLPQAGAAVFEAVPGVPMTQLLRREANRLTGPFCRRRICRLARHSGEWLRSFHALTARPAVERDSAGYLAKLSYWLEKSRSRGLETETADTLWAAANQMSRKAGKTLTPVAGVHGDFIPQNIFVSGHDISVIDFASFKEPETIYEDLGLFVAYLRLLASAPAYSRGAVTAMTHTFLEGYGDCLTAGVLNLYVLKAMVMIFADQFTSGEECAAKLKKIRRIKSQLARASCDARAGGD
jgi:hypothetical protein